ncbi:MAG TPA: ABC transporter ATP-binding protein [Ktedonobacteraceae bacterium]|nr:ABC transporter ATP-binding protein [Ktedonobacteraceae bacterium]
MTTTVATNKLLEVKNLGVDYSAANGTVHAVIDVSFTLERGKVLGLAGESGSGKSTLAYAITRLLRPPALITGGKVIYYPEPIEKSNGAKHAKNNAWELDAPTDILQCSPQQLRAFRWDTMAIVFQSAMNALNPVMNIGAQIMDVLQTHRPEMGPDARRIRAIELLKLVGIAPDRLRSYPHELSGGMRQRAVIAIALALNPEIIIMDEPTTALDVVVQREILTEIMQLSKEFGFSVIFITHDLSLLLELADNVAIMYAGRIVEYASQDDLYSHPRHPYSYGLLNSFPTLYGPRLKMAGIPGTPPDLRAIPSGCAFHPRCPLAFEPCNRVLPILQPLNMADSEQSSLVACHLYDARFREEPPGTEEIGTHYAALAERSERS